MAKNWFLEGFREGTVPSQIARIIEYERALLEFWRNSGKYDDAIMFVPVLHTVFSEEPPSDPRLLLRRLEEEYWKAYRSVACKKLGNYCLRLSHPVCSVKSRGAFDESVKEGEIEEGIEALKGCPLTEDINVDFIHVKLRGEKCYTAEVVVPLLKGRRRSTLISSSRDDIVSSYTALSLGLRPEEVIVGVCGLYRVLFPTDATAVNPYLIDSSQFYVSLLLAYVLSYLAPPHIRLSAAARMRRYAGELRRMPKLAEELGVDQRTARSLILVKIFADALQLDREVKEYYSGGRERLAWVKLYELVAVFLFLFGIIPPEFLESDNLSYKLNALHQPIIKRLSEETTDLVKSIPELLGSLDKIKDGRLKRAIEKVAELGGSEYVEQHPFAAAFIFLSELLGERGWRDLGFNVDYRVIERLEECINSAIDEASLPAEEDATAVGADYVFPNQFELSCGSTHNAVVELQIGNKIKFYFFDNKPWRARSAARAFEEWGRKCNAKVISQTADSFIGELYYKSPDDKECICLAPYIAFLSTSIDIYGCNVFDADSVEEAIRWKEECAQNDYDSWDEDYYEEEEEE